MQNKKRAAHTPLGKAWETFERGKQVFDMGEYKVSVEVFKSALDQFKQLLEDEGAAMSNAAIAAALNNTMRPQAAIEYALEAIDFYQRLDLHPQLAEQRQNIALMYSALGKSEEAEKYHVLAAESYEAINMAEAAGQNKHTAANLFARRQQVAPARQYFTEAIKLFEQADAPTAHHSHATALMQLAYLEKLDNKTDASILLYQEALEAFVDLNQPWEIGTCHEGLAAVYFDQNQPDVAVEHAKLALDTYAAHGFEEDARRAAANYQATLVAASFANRRAKNTDTGETGEE